MPFLARTGNMKRKRARQGTPVSRTPDLTAPAVVYDSTTSSQALWSPLAPVYPEVSTYWPEARPWVPPCDKPYPFAQDFSRTEHLIAPPAPPALRIAPSFPMTVASPCQLLRDGIDEWEKRTVDYLEGRTAFGENISSKLDSLINRMDEEIFGGDPQELLPVLRGGGGVAAKQLARGVNQVASRAFTGTNYFAKVNSYANARLPPNLPRLKLYMPTYPLLCLAAQCSRRVYARPAGAEREVHVDADWRLGTKAMVIKSVPLDDMRVLVFAIRGSQTFMDWAVNLNTAPISPAGFLDDPGNLCHAGFLSVARKMVKPVAARLRMLLREDPGRAACSLIITGHSAGGAVATLLYAHMLAHVRSELNLLTGCFRRVHCITFGTPPVSLLPLAKPPTRALRESLFLSFINEGDPVPRADRAYVRSLLDLYSSPAPGQNCRLGLPLARPGRASPSPALLTREKKPPVRKVASRPNPTQIVWRVPPATLSNAGRLVLLRSRPGSNPSASENVQACITTDQQLRGVIFGDPLMHVMELYERRIEILATNAVLARNV
ncbi:MAG: hypothetical protein M1838_005175 [Thelocarpon superellum]|nr:MAG: hypothetical protein M1838_005175 [Thelocarpon superellum]